MVYLTFTCQTRAILGEFIACCYMPPLFLMQTSVTERLLYFYKAAKNKGF